MKTFTFLAKQGQHEQIARLLTENFGKPHLSLWGNGVLIKLILPAGVSKRNVERLLYEHKVPGAHSRKNKFQVLKLEGTWDTYTVRERIGYHRPFVAVIDGKMQKMELEYYDYGCTCCGGYDQLKPL